MGQPTGGQAPSRHEESARVIPPIVIHALTDDRLSPRARAVLTVLWSYATKDCKTVFPKRETVALKANTTRSEVSRETTALEAAGYLVKEGAGGYSKATRYHLFDQVGVRPDWVPDLDDEPDNGVNTDTVTGDQEEQQRCQHRHRNDLKKGVSADTVSPNNGVSTDTGPRVSTDTRKEVTTGRDLSTGSSTKAGTLSRTRARDGPRSARTPEETSNRQERRDDRPEQRATTSAQPGRGLPRATPRGSGGPRQDPRQRRRGESAVAYVTRVQELDARERAGDGATVDLAARDWRRE